MTPGKPLGWLLVGAGAVAACAGGALWGRGPGRGAGGPGGAGPLDPATPPPRPAVVFLGDSLTHGHGLSREEAFPALLDERIRAVAPGLQVVNAGESGMTSAGGLERIDWILSRPVAVMVLGLGANDGLRGLDPDATRRNLEAIIRKARDHGARVVLAGMKVPPNYGPDYRRRFEEVYAGLARSYDLPFIPFLLDGVGGHPELNQADGVHPNAPGQRQVAGNVWTVLEGVLDQLRGPTAAIPRVPGKQ